MPIVVLIGILSTYDLYVENISRWFYPILEKSRCSDHVRRAGRDHRSLNYQGYWKRVEYIRSLNRGWTRFHWRQHSWTSSGNNTVFAIDSCNLGRSHHLRTVTGVEVRTIKDGLSDSLSYVMGAAGRLQPIRKRKLHSKMAAHSSWDNLWGLCIGNLDLAFVQTSNQIPANPKTCGQAMGDAFPQDIAESD